MSCSFWVRLFSACSLAAGLAGAIGAAQAQTAPAPVAPKPAAPVTAPKPAPAAEAAVPAAPAASPATPSTPQVRFVSDEMAITLRKSKGVDAPVGGLLASGTRVELLETDAPSGYARVRIAPGREGWVLARYLSAEPAARERLAKLQMQLDEQQAMVRLLEAENARLRDPLSRPVGSAAPDGAGASRGSISTAHAAAGETASVDRTENMVSGALIFIVGLLAGLVLHWLPRRERRNWADL